MTYFGFLARFVVLPLFIIRFLIWRDRRSEQDVPDSLQNWPENGTLLAHVVVAVTYTTPWDNYLVASNVWSYDDNLVTGHTIGWVPIEEYSFFVLQTLLAGSWTQYLMSRIPADDIPYVGDMPRKAAIGFTAGLGLLWLASLKRLAGDRRDYLALILGWALPPIMLQTGFGGDILWRHRSLIAASILPTTTYLGATDSLAISKGIWDITDEHTTGAKVVSKHLPFEELLFFFVTNVLLVFGVTLVQSKESEERLPAALKPAYTKFKERLLKS